MVSIKPGRAFNVYKYLYIDPHQRRDGKIARLPLLDFFSSALKSCINDPCRVGGYKSDRDVSQPPNKASHVPVGSLCSSHLTGQMLG